MQGIRISGRDNNAAVENYSFEVTGDQEYVVAYGIKGNQVAYTINYQDANGNKLADSQTFYGNVGDKPVVAYTYIDGYTPEYRNLTKTLSANAAENVFTFNYLPYVQPVAQEPMPMAVTQQAQPLETVMRRAQMPQAEPAMVDLAMERMIRQQQAQIMPEPIRMHRVTKTPPPSVMKRHQKQTRI